MTGLEASARYGCSHAAPDSCPWCRDHALDAQDRRKQDKPWRFEEPRRLSDREYAHWLDVLHGQAQQEPLRRPA